VAQMAKWFAAHVDVVAAASMTGTGLSKTETEGVWAKHGAGGPHKASPGGAVAVGALKNPQQPSQGGGGVTGDDGGGRPGDGYRAAHRRDTARAARKRPTSGKDKRRGGDGGGSQRNQGWWAEAGCPVDDKGWR
jgi:hypothetical protein